MSADFAPVPHPRGDLVPPGRVPPTAVGTATPPPPRPPRPSRTLRTQGPRSPFPRWVGRALGAVLDATDRVADAVARAAGLRRPA